MTAPTKKVPIRLRSGVSAPGLLGMYRQGTPALIPDPAFHHLENGRFYGPHVKDRPGQQKATNQVTGPIEGMYDTADIGAAVASDSGGSVPPSGLYFTGVAPSQTRGVLRFDPVGLTITGVPIPPVNDGSTPWYIVQGLTKGSDERIYIAGCLYTPATGQAKPAVYRVDVTTGGLTEVFSIPSVTAPQDDTAGFTMLSLLEDPSAAGIFYAAQVGQIYDDSSPAPGTVYRNGVLDDTAVFVNPDGAVTYPHLVAFNGTIYATWGANSAAGSKSDTIRKRNAANNWANLTLPAPPAGFDRFQPNDRPAVFGPKLYVAGLWMKVGGAGNERVSVLSVTTGDVVTTEHTVGVAINLNSVSGVHVFNNRLYYLYLDPSISPHAVLAKYDGVTWTDSEWTGLVGAEQFDVFDIVADPTGAARLYATAVGSISGEEWVLGSNGTDTTTWVKLAQNTTGIGLAYADMVAKS